MHNTNFLLWRQPNQSAIELFRLTKEASSSNQNVTFAPFAGAPVVYHVLAAQTVAPSQLSAEISFPLQNLENSVGVKQETHERLVQHAVTTLQQTALQKVVLARTSVVDATPNPIHLFLRLHNAYPNACVFLFNTPETGCWMGTTPETLLHVNAKQAFANSLAGTRPLGTVERWGAKEMEEQQLVTNEIATSFKRIGVTEIRLDGPVTKAAGPVEHLFTQVSGSVPTTITPEEMASHLHPTPAVGGLPRNEALKFIAEHEQINRSFYAGYFGTSTKHSGTFYVNLRSMQLFKNGLILYAGGGITAASNPQAEWIETERKLQTLLSVLNEYDL